MRLYNVKWNHANWYKNLLVVLKVWTVSQVIRRVQAVFIVAQQDPLLLHVIFQLQLEGLPNKKWLYRRTNYGVHTVQYTAVNFLAASFVACDRRQNCDVIIILHRATHFELWTPSLDLNASAWVRPFCLVHDVLSDSCLRHLHRGLSTTYIEV